MLVDVKLVKKTRLSALEEMREPRARGHGDAARGNRLSITPVTAAEWKAMPEAPPGLILPAELVPWLTYAALGVFVGSSRGCSASAADR
jgi:hypothetical protein